MDSRLYVPVLEVDCSDREIVLRGIVRNSVQYEGIVETARELAGDTPVKVELRYRA
jgi:osmotically-inducible protein OsmY